MIRDPLHFLAVCRTRQLNQALSVLSLSVATRHTRSAALPLLNLPSLSTDFARRSFSYAAPKIWNSLPTEISSCNSEATFKKHLKTHLYKNCFYTV